jgi:hypothetical protein
LWTTPTAAQYRSDPAWAAHPAHDRGAPHTRPSDPIPLSSTHHLGTGEPRIDTDDNPCPDPPPF